MIEWIHPDELRNHPANTSIYGDTPDQEFVESVRQRGVFPHTPIGYVQDGDFKVIVSGHRRRQAAKIAKLDMVPVVRLKDIEGDELAIKEMIVASNANRQKTREQMAREAALLAEIESERASLRQKQGGKWTPLSPLDSKGATREKVAKVLKTSERTAQRLIEAGRTLIEAEASGDKELAEDIKHGLEHSVRAGDRAAKPQKNGTVVAPVYDEKRIDKPLGVIRRELDERLAAFPGTDRQFRAAKHALSEFANRVEDWRGGK